MRVVYTILLVILVAIYAKVLTRVLKSSVGLTPLLGWMIGLAYFVIGPLAIMTLNGGFELPPAYQVDNRWARVDLTNTTFLLPYLLIWASLLSSCLAVHIFFSSSGQDDKTIYSVSRNKLKRALLICMAIAMAIWALQIWLVGGVAQFLVSHWYERGEDLFSRYGESYVLLAQITLANQLVYTGTAALYTSCGLKNRDTKPWFTTLIILFFLCSIVMTGNRIFFASYLLACFTSCWLLRRRKLIAMMLALAPVLVLVFSAWSAVRHDIASIPDSVGGYAEADYGNRTVTSLVNVTEGMSVMLLLHIINDFGNRYEFLDGLTYSRTFTALIPRRIYPQKPLNFTLVLAKAYQPGITTSLNATAVGEMYANFGALTLLFFPLLTMGILRLNRWALQKERAHPLLPPIVFILLVWVSRGTLADNFIHFIIALALISILRYEKGLGSAPRAGIGPVL
jgi:oligosaccharide repeat unit polymerase